MRTTVTLDPDTEQIVRRLTAERGVSFNQALNDAIRDGGRSSVTSVTRTASMGRSTVNLDRALSITGDPDDEDLLRRMRLGS